MSDSAIFMQRLQQNSTIFYAIASGIVLVAIWLSLIYVPRFDLLAAGIFLLGILAALYRYPIIIISLAIFLITSGTADYVPGGISALLALSIGISISHKIINRNTNILFLPLISWAILLFVWQAFSILWSASNDWYTISGLYRNLLVMFAVILVIDGQKDLAIIALVAGIGITVTSIMSVKSVYEFFTSGLFTGDAGLEQHIAGSRYFGAWKDPNILSQTIVPFLGLVYAFIRLSKQKLHRWILAITFAAGITAILISLSRAGIISFVIMMFVILIAERKRLLIAGALIGISVFIVSFFPIDILGRLGSIGSGQADASISQRTQLMAAGINLFEESFPLGVGLGNFRTYSADYVNSAYISMIPHNTYTEILSEYGIVGITLYLGAIVSVFCALWHGRHSIDVLNHRQTIRVCMRGMLCCMLFSNMFLSLSTYPPYWLLLTLMAVEPYLKDESEGEVRYIEPRYE